MASLLLQLNETGVLLSLFSNHCTQSYTAAKDPASIVEDFFERYAPEYSETERHDMLFRFIQYIERQKKVAVDLILGEDTFVKTV